MALLSPSDVDGLLRAHGLRASRALGQHFLADPNTARRIVRLAEVGPQDHVLEIGPGVGSLTLALAGSGTRVLALERDRHVLPALHEVLGRAGASELVTVEQADALDADVEALLAAAAPDPETPWIMISNLPYNVATPLLVRFLRDVPRVTRFLVMIQREVAERLAARPGERTAGSVTITVAYHAEARVVGRVPPTVFVPRPGVESALLQLRRHERPPVDVDSPERLFALARTGFAQRRKTLGRALRPAFGDRTAELLDAAGIDRRARAEALTLDQWAALADAALARDGEGR